MNLFVFATTALCSQGLVASWTFDSSSSSTYYDVTGHGYNAIVSNTLQIPGATTVPGVKGNAIGLAGGNYEIVANNSKDSFNLKRFTVECWLYSNLLPSTYVSIGAYIFDQQAVASGIRNGYGLYVTPSGNVELSMSDAYGASWYQAQSITIMQGNKWYHIVGTYDSLSLKVYVNGVCETTLPCAGGYAPSTVNARIGCQRLIDGTLRCFTNGKLDELKLYNYALSPDTIMTHYTVQKPYKINIGMKSVFAKPGDSIWVPLYVTNFENFSISSCQFSLHFDTSIVKLAAISRDSGIANGWDLVSNATNIDSVIIAMGGLTKAISYGEGELIRCEFAIKPNAILGSSTYIDIQNVRLDENSQVIATLIPGKITVATPLVMYGDVTGNGEVTALDAARVLEYVVGQISLPNSQYPNFTKTVADVSGDGTISSYDAALIFQYSVGLFANFPIQNVASLQKRSVKESSNTVAEMSLSSPQNIGTDIYQYTLHAKNIQGFIAGQFVLQCNPSIVASIKDISPMIRNANLRAQFDNQLQCYNAALTTNDKIDSTYVDLFVVTVQQQPGIAQPGMSIKTVQVNEGMIPITISSAPVKNNMKILSQSFNHDNIEIQKDQIVIENQMKSSVNIQMFDIMGRLLVKKEYSPDCVKFILDKKAFNPGLYVLKIEQGTSTFMTKIAITGR